MKNRAFSLYDIEEFIKEAGAERINEKAVVSLEEELETTVKELVDEARVYANYAGRTRNINHSDIELAANGAKKTGQTHMAVKAAVKRRSARRGPDLRNIVNVTVQEQRL